jgi:hypothetical protein
MVTFALWKLGGDIVRVVGVSGLILSSIWVCLPFVVPRYCGGSLGGGASNTVAEFFCLFTLLAGVCRKARNNPSCRAALAMHGFRKTPPVRDACP